MTILEKLFSHKEYKEAFNEYNSKIGNSLTLLNNNNELLGRDNELNLLRRILQRPKTPVALLLGDAGVGKTALVEEFVKKENQSSNINYVLFALRVGQLGAIGTGKLQAEMANILTELSKLEDIARFLEPELNIKFILFIDEVHMIVTIFGPGTKIGGDVLKDILARPPIKVIAATTKIEYDSTIATDAPLAQRFKQIEIKQLNDDVMINILKTEWNNYAPHIPEPSTELFKLILEINNKYRSEQAEPRRSLDTLEDCISICQLENKILTKSDIYDIFRQRFSINLSYNIDHKAIYNQLRTNVIGQNHAIEAWRKLLQSLKFRVNASSSRPIFTALLTGPTGVGKSESVKQIAKAMYDTTKVLHNINMPDYRTAESEELFRKNLGSFVKHTPNAVILFDELEKSHTSIKDSLLAILDEGIVTYHIPNREGGMELMSVSLRNTIVIATTNEGSVVFANDARFSEREINSSQNQMKAELKTLTKSITEHLKTNGFKPELLGRFDSIIPYRSLDAQTVVTISDILIKSIIEDFEMISNVKVNIAPKKQWENSAFNYYGTDLALYISFIKLNIGDSDQGGARNIKHTINSEILNELIDFCINNSNVKELDISVSKNTKIYKHYASYTEGGIIINAVR